MSEPVFKFMSGDQPVLISCPHVGTHVPQDIAERFTPAGGILADTDWYVDWLYGEAAAGLGLSLLSATHSRYVIDLNRHPDGSTLYAKADNTELCPTTTFDHAPIYLHDAPGEAEILRRRDNYWQPYHDKLRTTLDAMVSRHGVAVLIDAHSIGSQVPRFFDGTLPHFNLGTADGTSAHGDLTQRVFSVLSGNDDYDAVLNARFKGGHITRHYGQPDKAIHALQLEMIQSCYMDESPPFAFRTERAQSVQPIIERMLETVLEWAVSRSRG